MRKDLRYKDDNKKINTAVESLQKRGGNTKGHVILLYCCLNFRYATVPLKLLLTSSITDLGIVPALAPKVM